MMRSFFYDDRANEITTHFFKQGSVVISVKSFNYQVGMFSREPVWFIPHGSGTVLITVGSIEKRMVFNGERYEEREFLCLTGSFDHDIVDGAPAARFMNQFLETVKRGIGLGSREA